MLVELLQSLFKNDLETCIALSDTMPYIQVCQGEAILVIRCPNLSSLKLLNLLSRKLVAKIEPMGYGIYLECIEYEKVCPDDRDKRMVAVLEQEQSTVYANGTDASIKLLNLEKLVTALRKPASEVKLMLARQGAAVYPQQDGTEAIAEPIFDALILRWAKSIKEQGEATTEQKSIEGAKPPRKSSLRVLTTELTADDIVRNKSGKAAGKANLTVTGIQSTLEKFFNKVKLDDTSLVDAVSAFIEGTSETGKELRKKLLAAYKKHAGAAPSEIESKLVDGAKKFLEAITTQPDNSAA